MALTDFLKTKKGAGAVKFQKITAPSPFSEQPMSE
jgi:hypothetical protein